MEFKDIKQLYMDKKLRESSDIEQIDEISKYDLVVTYYRHLGLDPYKLRGKTGSLLRAKIKNSPAFQSWVKTRSMGVESVQYLNNDELTEKDKSVEKSGKPFDAKKASKVTFFGYPDKNAKPSDTVKDETGTNFNYITPN